MAELFGRVVKTHIAVGSKSERDAVCLDTGEKQLILRRQHANPFHDEELEKLVGKRIRAGGDMIGGGTFLMSGWSELSEE
jgi:hypothetical protein